VRLPAVAAAPVSLDWAARLGIGLTLAKIPLTIFMTWLMFARAFEILNFVVVFTMLIDIADGVIFERSAHANNRFLRESRRIWDSALDRVVIWTMLCLALIIAHFPIMLFLILMLREFAVCGVTSYPYIKRGFVHSPNLPSKIGAVLIGVQFIFFTSTNQVPVLSTISCVAFSIVGLWLYVVKPKQI
jgi:phosphatidylglycerophosphate synthase